MSEEKKEIKSSVEDDKKSEKEAEKENDESDKKSEEEKSQKDDFEKDSETVPAGKYNQAIRKQREIELEKRELERQLAEVKTKPKKKEDNEEEEDEDFFKDEEEEKKEPIDPSKLIDERLRPVMETLKKREENDKKNSRTAFFNAHPEYLNNSEKWQGLLDEMDNSLNPNSKDDYYTQLEKAHRILAGEAYNAEVENKKSEIASDSSGSGGSEKTVVKDEFTSEERKQMKDFKISEDGMRAYKQKTKDGSMLVM